MSNEKLSNGKSKDGHSTGPSGSWFGRLIAAETADFASVDLWRAVLAEFLATMMLCVWTIGMGLVNEGGDPPSLLMLGFGTGAFIIGLVATFVNVSGCHINPAVSVGILVCRKMTIVRFICYVAAQIASSIAGVWVIQAAFPKTMHGSLGHIIPGPDSSISEILSMEFLLGFNLMLAVASYIDENRSDLMGLLGLYVGFVVAGNIIFGAGVSGGCMNPARYFGPAVMTGNTELIWAYSLGPMAGAACAALIYNLLLSEHTVLASVCCKTSRKAADTDGSPETEVMIQET